MIAFKQVPSTSVTGSCSRAPGLTGGAGWWIAWSECCSQESRGHTWGWAQPAPSAAPPLKHRGYLCLAWWARVDADIKVFIKERGCNFRWKKPLSVLIFFFFPCELSACVSIISYVFTQILSPFGSAPTHPQMNPDGLFFLSAGEKINIPKTFWPCKALSICTDVYMQRKRI